jgi:hypothetical protein
MRKTDNKKKNVNQLCFWAMLLPAILFIDIDWIRHNISVEDRPSSFMSFFYARKKVIVIINISAMFIREKKNKNAWKHWGKLPTWKQPPSRKNVYFERVIWRQDGCHVIFSRLRLAGNTKIRQSKTPFLVTSSSSIYFTLFCLWKHHVNVLLQSLFTWCFHKQNYYMFYRHANIQRTYYFTLFGKNIILEEILMHNVYSE